MPKTATKSWFNKCILLGTGENRIRLPESHTWALFSIAFRDINWSFQEFGFEKPNLSFPSSDYFQIPISWFSGSSEVPNYNLLLELSEKAINKNPDFGLFFTNLCSLHKRRIKYQQILQRQPRPNMDQIGPRSLLEYGIADSSLIANWMILRKWIFDIDNRSGQETGYLFEPILASCLGGAPVSASKSPVKRIDSSGKPLQNGRQIDCLVAHENTAIEFKLRVTIAASGQGRFAEELSFPRECTAAGIKPVLFVLDPTPSSRLSELENEYHACGGESFVGEAAWDRMEEIAGDLVSIFLEKYIKAPLLKISQSVSLQLPTFTLSWDEDHFSISDGVHKYSIEREGGSA